MADNREMRRRAKDHFPMVLLTLLSIMQALALELLWSHMRGADYLFESTFVALVSWAQIAATFLGVVLIWLVYTSTAMRFRWVPTTSDSVYPFVIGILEFMLIESLGPQTTGYWLILVAIIFATLMRVSHKILRCARYDGDNDYFFKDLSPATWRDFAPNLTTLSLIGIAGIYLVIRPQLGIFALLAVVATTGVMVWQSVLETKYWRESVG